jgi:hypothetical protein
MCRPRPHRAGKKGAVTAPKQGHKPSSAGGRRRASVALQVDQLSWTELRGMRVLEIKFESARADEAGATVSRVIAELTAQPRDSVLMLADVSNATFLPGVVMQWQNHQRVLTDYCRRIAVVGARKAISVAARAFLSVTDQMGLPLSRKVTFFDDAATARTWLIDGSGVRKPVRQRTNA